MRERETGSDVCVRVVRQEDGTQIHQQREEGKETQAEDDGRNRWALTADTASFSA